MTKLIATLTCVVIAVVMLFPTAIATGNKEDRQESVCVSYYYSGSGGTSHRVCNGYKTVTRTYCEYNYTNFVTSWTGFGGCADN